MSDDAHLIRPVSVVEVAIWREGHYLLMRRAITDSFPWEWNLCAGAVELQDGPVHVLRTAARREMAEETGLHGGTLHYVSTRLVGHGADLAAFALFLCIDPEGQPTITQPEEVGDLRWMAYDEIMAMPDLLPWVTRSVIDAEQARTQILAR